MEQSYPELRQRLSANTRKYLDLELTKPSGTHAAVATVATGCMLAGLTQAEFQRVISVSPLGDEIHSSRRIKTPGQFDKFVLSAWRFSEDNYRADYFDDSLSIQQQLEMLLHRIQTGTWTGRTASTDRAVAAALVTMALDAGGRAYSVHASTRQLSVESGIGTTTVSRALHRLRAGGPIKSVQLRGKGNSRVWTLDLSWGTTATSGTDVLRIKNSSVPVRATTHEAFIGSGSLGQPSARIWDWLSARLQATRPEIVAGTGLGDATVRKHTARMVELGMLHRDGTRNARYSIVDTANLDAVAEQLGSAGWRERTKARHDQEREWMGSPLCADPELLQQMADGNLFRVVSVPDPFDKDDTTPRVLRLRLLTPGCPHLREADPFTTRELPLTT
jgi:hypothetical protein